jgi:hypothetical protein
MRGRTRRHLVASASAIALMWPTPGRAAPAAPVDTRPEREAMVCTWGGTPAATTGTFTIKPGLTLTPSAGPLRFVATGPLEGGAGCEGKLTFIGVIHAGGTCATQEFEGKVRGLPGVHRFWGPGGVLGVLNEFLYDKDGNIVGTDQPQVLSGINRGGSELSDCNTPAGFTDGDFSSVVELFGS